MRLSRPLLLATLAAALVLPSTASAEQALELNYDGANYHVERFDTTTPTLTDSLLLTGVAAGFEPVAIDVRPANGAVYLLAMNNGGGANDTAIQLYTLNVDTGAVTAIGAPITGLVDAADWGFDVNPVADRIRVTNSADKNFRLHPDTGALVASDGDISGGDVHAVAYTNNVVGAAVTTAFALDGTADKLLILNPPNAGVTSEVGPLSAPISTVASFDISGDTGTAYVLDGGTLSSLNLITGVLTTVATRASANSRGFAILPQPKFTVAAATGTEASGTASITVTRAGSSSFASTVALATSDGTAAAGSDYVAVATTVGFAAGQTSRTVQVPVLDDRAVEGDETFTVTLSSPQSPAALGATTSAAVTITSDDVAPPADKAAPIVLLQTLTATSYAKLAKFGEAVRWSCSEACTTTLTLKLGTTTIGTGRKVLSAPGVTSIGIKVTPRGKVLLAKRLRLAPLRRQALSLTMVSTDAAGNKRVTRGAFVVRR